MDCVVAADMVVWFGCGEQRWLWSWESYLL